MGRNRRAIGELMAILIVVAIVAVVGIMLFLTFSGMLRGTGRAVLTVSATGTASPDGSSATITLVLQNTGEGTARITGIYVEPLGTGTSQAPNPTGVTVVGAAGVSGAAVAPPASPQPMPASGFDLASQRTATISVRFSATGVYPGHQYRISVLYYDIASRAPAIADTIVTLR
ncbi:MAG: hypothetical protein QW512_01890 [Thermofilaceae archaeon]